MNNIYVVYCPNCGTDTGVAGKNQTILSEFEYNCSVCGKKGVAKEGIIKEVNKEVWQSKKEYYED